MDEKIKVSVIVPIYNVEQYLAECLDSLEKQTLKENEVILVIDGSTDSSEQIAGTYVDRNDNFRLILQENRGIGGARNTGLEIARGEYVYFLDSDDFVEENALEVLYSKACQDNLDVLFFGARTFVDGENEFKWPCRYSYKKDYETVVSGEKLLENLMKNRDLCNPNCGMFFSKLSLYSDGHLRFREKLLYEDNLFYPELICSAGKSAVINIPLMNRRYRDTSVTMSSDNSEDKLRSTHTVVSELMRRRKECGKDRASWLFLNRACFRFSEIYYSQPVSKRKNFKNEYKEIVSVIMKEKLFGRRFRKHIKTLVRRKINRIKR